MQQTWAIVRKDLAMEMRSRERMAATLVFALIVTFVFHFTLDLRATDTAMMAPGVLWVAFGFAGMLGLSRSFVRERDEGCLDALLLCPVDRSVIYLGKMLGNLLFVSSAEALLLPVLFALFNLTFPPLLLAIIPLGTLGLCAVGTLFAAMTAYTRAREMLLPVLFFPIVIPVLIAAARFTAGLFDGLPWAEIAPWFHFVVGFDVILLTACYLSFEYIVEE